MKSKFFAGCVIALAAIGCSGDKGPTAPDTEFAAFLEGTLLVQNSPIPAEQWVVDVTDNSTQQNVRKVVYSDGHFGEERWLSVPTSLRVRGQAQFGQIFQPFEYDHVIPVCVDHPEDHRVKLCRFTIDIVKEN